jgi:hypothetical protein
VLYTNDTRNTVSVLGPFLSGITQSTTIDANEQYLIDVLIIPGAGHQLRALCHETIRNVDALKDVAVVLADS